MARNAGKGLYTDRWCGDITMWGRKGERMNTIRDLQASADPSTARATTGHCQYEIVKFDPVALNHLVADQQRAPWRNRYRTESDESDGKLSTLGRVLLQEMKKMGCRP